MAISTAPGLALGRIYPARPALIAGSITPIPSATLQLDLNILFLHTTLYSAVLE